MITTDYKGRV